MDDRSMDVGGPTSLSQVTSAGHFLLLFDRGHFRRRGSAIDERDHPIETLLLSGFSLTCNTSLLGTRTLLGAPGIATRNKGLTTRTF